MTFKSDPPRLKSAASGSTEAARALLDRGRSEVPDAAAIARLASRLPLAPPPGGGAPAPGAAPGAPIAAGASVAPSAVIGAVLAIGVLGGAWWQGSARDAPPPAPREPAAAIAAPRATTSPIATAIAAPPEAVTAAPATEPAPATASPAASPAPPPRDPPSAAANAGSPSPSASATAETEVELLRRARESLGSNPAGALAAAEEHRARFAGGVLAQEREVIAISALIALGRRADARARAARFVASYPRSVHRANVESMTDLPP